MGATPFIEWYTLQYQNIRAVQFNEFFLLSLRESDWEINGSAGQIELLS
jgi:hypothetical protein